MQLESWTITGNGFHFGKHGLGQEQTYITMPSDSLFAALVSRMACMKAHSMSMILLRLSYLTPLHL